MDKKPEETQAAAAETKVETPVETKVEEKTVPEKTEEKSIGEVLETQPPKEEPKENVIPEAAFLEEKKGRKAAEKRVKELESLVKSGASSGEVSDDIDSIATEFNIDKDFLVRYGAAIRAQAKAEAKNEAGAEIENRFKPLEEKERAAKIDAAFSKAYKQAIEKMPEFEAISNPEVIKTLSLQPQNAHKTFSQIIEETYGSALTGKRTIDTTKPGGGKEPEPLDYDKARMDGAYFDEVMANPKLKEAYNAEMLKRGI